LSDGNLSRKIEGGKKKIWGDIGEKGFKESRGKKSKRDVVDQNRNIREGGGKAGNNSPKVRKGVKTVAQEGQSGGGGRRKKKCPARAGNWRGGRTEKK